MFFHSRPHATLVLYKDHCFCLDQMALKCGFTVKQALHQPLPLSLPDQKWSETTEGVTVKGVLHQPLPWLLPHSSLLKTGFLNATLRPPLYFNH